MNTFEIIISIFFLIISIGVMVCVASQNHEQKQGGIGGQMLISSNMETNKKRIVTEKIALNRITMSCSAFIAIFLVVYYAVQ